MRGIIDITVPIIPFIPQTAAVTGGWAGNPAMEAAAEADAFMMSGVY